MHSWLEYHCCADGQLNNTQTDGMMQSLVLTSDQVSDKVVCCLQFCLITVLQFSLLFEGMSTENKTYMRNK